MSMELTLTGKTMFVSVTKFIDVLPKNSPNQFLGQT